MKQQEVDIYSLKKGDLITRVRPSKPIPGSEGFGEDIRDRSYIGKPMIFLGIANGCVYVEKPAKNEDEDSPMNLFSMLFDMKTGPINLPLDIWSEGWSYYIDPYNINTDETKKAATKILKGANEIELKKQLKKALSEEDYELADQIQKRLDNLK